MSLQESTWEGCFPKVRQLRGGIAPGDFITAVEGQKVWSYAQIMRFLNRKGPGQPVKLEVIRPPRFEPLNFEITLAELPDI